MAELAMTATTKAKGLTNQNLKDNDPNLWILLFKGP